MAAYHFICLNHDSGDEIIMIGYSRGALAVRCIINLIEKMGLLSRRGLANLHLVFDCWWNETSNELELEQCNWQSKPYSIKVCGLWDTVDSVGRAGIFGPGSLLGIKRDGIPSSVTNDPISSVENVFHALSLHERRSLFQPTIANVNNHEEQTLEQCWFSGYHGDVGGGRADDVLAHLALIWMMGKLYHFVELDDSLFFYEKTSEETTVGTNVEMNPSAQKAYSESISKFVIGLCITRSADADWFKGKDDGH